MDSNQDMAIIKEKENLKFVIVGHVDHGKSTLIGRLFFDTNSLPMDKIYEFQQASRELGKGLEFAFLMDHLQEEREQGITIDTTQAFFKTQKREYVIIDAPGHVEFIKNMITGASQAEAAILIVDINKGVQEQTKRHSYILGMLGLEQVIVVLNKMDLVNYNEKRFNQVKKELEKFLYSINIKDQFYIPISASKGDNVAKKSINMDWYKGLTILESLDFLKTKRPPENKPLIFPVQDVYKIDNKRIVVGRIETGVIKKGQLIKVLPAGQIIKVKSIEKFSEDVNESHPGESIGITIQDPIFLERGNIICEPGKELSLTDTFKANVFWMIKEDFKKDESITLRCATQEILCKVEKIEKRIDSSSLEVIEENSNKLKNLEVGKIVIKTERPIAIKTFNDIQELGRFVFVKGNDICAGGIIMGIE
ncbi:GTP-binding protein [candidate division WOR-3 bacterium]|nr:GTP-binding protein [candidate division WOR-3 bacterium]